MITRATIGAHALGACLASSLVIAAPTRAQLSLGPATSSRPDGVAPVRWPDVAYDGEHDVFLATTGAGRVGGVRLDREGSVIGAPFAIDAASALAQAPRVTHVDGVGFVVAWHETVGDATELRGRIVRHDASFATDDLVLSPQGTNWEMGAAIAGSPASHVVLVAWQSIPERQIVAQRISVAAGSLGERIGEPIVVDPRTIYFRDPAVVHEPRGDRFVVAYADCEADGACSVHAQRLEAASGARVGEPIVLEAGLDAGYVPELVAIGDGSVLAVWHARAGFAATFHARAIGEDAALSPLVTATTLGSYDANGLAYAPRSGTALLVTHGSTAEDVAIELDARGNPLGEPLAFGPSGASGNFNPRVVASTRDARFLAVTSTAFEELTTQRIATDTRTPSAGADAGGPIDAGSSIAIDAGPGRGSASCACALGAPRRMPWPSSLALGIGLAWIARGRKRGRSSIVRLSLEAEKGDGPR